MANRSLAFLQRLKNDRKGATLVFTAVSLTALCGLIGLGIDVGSWYMTQGELQTIADAAALGGARSAAGGANLTQLTAEANGDAGANGLSTANGDTLTVTQAWPNVTATVTRTGKSYFSGVLTTGNPTISATSQAGFRTVRAACLIALKADAPIGINIDSQGMINPTDCAVYSNSTRTNGGDGNASIVVGNGTLRASAISAVGDAMVANNGTVSPTPVTHAGATPDPYATLSGSSSPNSAAIAACSAAATPTVYKGTQTLSPGVYCGGISIQASATITMNPGEYDLVNGDLELNGGGINLTSAGVSFYLAGTTPGHLHIWNNGNNYNFSPMTTGWLSGILLYQDRSATYTVSAPGSSPGANSNDIEHGAKITATGVIYAPSGDFYVGKGSSLLPTSGKPLEIIAATFNVLDSGELGAASGATGTTTTQVSLIK